MLQLKWVGLSFCWKTSTLSLSFFISMSSVCGKEKNCTTSGQMLPLMVFAVRKGRSGVSLVLSSWYGCCKPRIGWQWWRLAWLLTAGGASSVTNTWLMKCLYGGSAANCAADRTFRNSPCFCTWPIACPSVLSWNIAVHFTRSQSNSVWTFLILSFPYALVLKISLPWNSLTKLRVSFVTKRVESSCMLRWRSIL